MTAGELPATAAAPARETRSLPEAWAGALVRLGERHPELVVLVADSCRDAGLAPFASRHGDRFIQVGRAEANLLGVAAGLAQAGKVPFASLDAGAASRALAGARDLLARGRLPVRLVGLHGGELCCRSGGARLADSDLAFFRSLPGFHVFAPTDAHEADAVATYLAGELRDRPAYVRLPREPLPSVTAGLPPAAPGAQRTLREGRDVALLACGSMGWRALAAAELLAQAGISCMVVAVPRLKPLDRSAVVAAAAATDHVVTLEEHGTTGGLGSAVAETLGVERPTRLRLMGFDDRPTEPGTVDEVLERFGLGPAQVAAEVRSLLRR